MKKILSLLLVFIMALGLTACGSSGGGEGGDGGNDVSIVGVWKSAEVEYEGKKMTMDEFDEQVVGMKGYTMTFTVKEDGTFIDEESAPDYGSYTYEGTWKQDGDKYSFTANEATIIMEIRDGKLVNSDSADMDGALIYFEKQ
ncbi:MAG: lipocalin family protein [Lachnospiraceae bacterium]|nr:lipocalin family protein [Lachnospiraceae bacterium]